MGPGTARGEQRSASRHGPMVGHSQTGAGRGEYAGDSAGRGPSLQDDQEDSGPPFAAGVSDGRAPKPKIGPYRDRIAAILEAEKALPRKQRHMAKRIFEVLQDEGYEGGYAQVKEAVWELRLVCQEAFLPLGVPSMQEAVQKWRGRFGHSVLFPAAPVICGLA